MATVRRLDHQHFRVRSILHLAEHTYDQIDPSERVYVQMFVALPEQEQQAQTG